MALTRRCCLSALAGGGIVLAAGCSDRVPSVVGSDTDAETRAEARAPLADNVDSLEAVDDSLSAAVSPASLEYAEVDTAAVTERSERAYEVLGDDAAGDRAAALRAVADYQVAVADVVGEFLVAGRQLSVAIGRAERFEFEMTPESAVRARDLAPLSLVDTANDARERVAGTDPTAETADLLSRTEAVLERRRRDIEGLLAVADVLEAYGTGSTKRLAGYDAYSDDAYRDAEAAFEGATDAFDRGLERLDGIDTASIHVPAFADSLESFRELLPAERAYVSAMRKAATAADAGEEERAEAYEAEADEAY